MKKQTSGFAIVELLILLVVAAGIAGVGYYIWHNHKNSYSTPASTSSSLNYQSPTTSTPQAPSINSTSGLNNAMSALNQTSIGSSTTDSNQLSSQTSGF